MINLYCCSRRIKISIEYVDDTSDEEITSTMDETESTVDEAASTMDEIISEPPAAIQKKPNYNHRYWPSPRPVLFAKYINYINNYKQETRLTHTSALEQLAKYAKCSVEELLKINPITYIQKYLNNTEYLYKKTIIDSREYHQLSLYLAYDTQKHKAETQQLLE